ncbi:HDOD domain-containing protein [Pseudomonas aeruginosa]
MLSVASRKTIVRILEKPVRRLADTEPDTHDRPPRRLARRARPATLPIPASHYAGLHAALSDSRRSLREIADQLQGSPTLALSILREANRAESARDNPAESLEVALSRLGLARASQLLKTLPSIQDAEMPRVLGQMLLISQHAMQQASGLFGARLARLWQEIHWGSLLTMAPVWALANARPQLLEQWQQRVLVQGEPTLRVERELLGMRLLPICLALAERWRLPQWVIQGYRLLACDRRLLVRALRIARDHQSPLLQQQQLDAQPDLARWLTQPANCTLLANGLAIAAHQSWDGPHMLRWQRLTGLYLGQPLTEVQQQVHMLAAQSARLHARPPLWHPAVALIWPWQASRWRAEAAPRRRPRRKPWPSGGSIAPSCSASPARSATWCSSPPVPAMRCAPAACKGCCCWWPIAPRYTCWRSRAPDSNRARRNCNWRLPAARC